MVKNIKKVTVLGSGIMGSGIACHLANIGLDVLLLDMVPIGEEEIRRAVSEIVSLTIL